MGSKCKTKAALHRKSSAEIIDTELARAEYAAVHAAGEWG